MTKPTDYIEMMDSFAQSIYDTIRPKSEMQPVVIEDMVNAFKELAAWAVKRHDIISATSESGGIGDYQKGIEGRGNHERESGADAITQPSASSGILAQLGTRKKTRKPARLPSYIEGDSSDSSGVSAEQPVVPVNGGGILAGLNGDARPNATEADGSGAV